MENKNVDALVAGFNALTDAQKIVFLKRIARPKNRRKTTIKFS